MRLIFSAIASGQLPIKVGQELKIAKPLLSAEDEQTENKEKLAEFTEANIPVTVCRLLKVSQSNSIDQLCTVELEPLNPVNVNYLLIHQPTRHMESANCPVVGISKFMKQPKSSCRGSGRYNHQTLSNFARFFYCPNKHSLDSPNNGREDSSVKGRTIQI